MGGFVLVVDDDADIRDTLKDVLEDEGYAVETAAHGEEALRVLERAIPCVIILDLMMPVLDGVATYHRLRAEARWAKIPVIISTSDPSRAPPGVLIIRKPIDLDLMLQTVEDRCGR